MTDIATLTRFTAQHWREMAAAQGLIFQGIVRGRDAHMLTAREIEQAGIASNAYLYCLGKSHEARANADGRASPS